MPAPLLYPLQHIPFHISVMNELPYETLVQICFHLQEHACVGSIAQTKHSLRHLSAVSRTMREVAEPLVWRSLHIVIAHDNVETLLAALDRLVTDVSRPHPVLRYTTRLEIALPAMMFHDARTVELVHTADSILPRLFAAMTRLQHLEIDFCMAQLPFPLLTAYLCSSGQSLSTLSVVGLYNPPAYFVMQLNACIRRLRIGNTGCSFRIDLDAFPNLTDLHLHLDCRAQRDHPFHFPEISPGLWSRLESLHLHTAGYGAVAERVISRIEASIQVNASESLLCIWLKPP